MSPCADLAGQPGWASRGRHANCVTPSSASPVSQACLSRRTPHLPATRPPAPPESTEASAAHERDRHGRATRSRTEALRGIDPMDERDNLADIAARAQLIL